jgi:hypothetical protein
MESILLKVGDKTEGHATLEILDRALERIDTSSVPKIEEQLKDL